MSEGVAVHLAEWLAAVGLNGDPFAHTNAEDEELLPDYFVPPPYFSSVRGDPRQPKSAIVFAPRGGGKTAQRRILETDSTSHGANYLCVLYDRFLEGSPGVDAHLDQLCMRILVGLLVTLEEEGVGKELLLAEDRQFLIGEAALLEGIDHDLFDALVTSLKSQGRRAADFAREHSGPIKSIVAALLAKRGIDLDPTLPWGPQMVAARESSPLSRLKRLIQVARNYGFESVYVLVDKLDETASTATNPVKAVELILALLLDLGVMELPGMAVKVFAWDLSQDHYHELGGRRDRVMEYQLTWGVSTLSEMMRRRLLAYSGGSIESLDQLASDDLDFSLHTLCCHLANGSPRDMIRLCARIISEHLNAAVGGGSGNQLVEASIWVGVSSFAAEICDERARKFVPDLLRLDTLRFTQNLVANDYLKISKQSTQAKVTDWRRTGMIDKITEVQDKRARPQHLYGVVDPRLAINLRPAHSPRDVLEYFAVECDACGRVNYSDDAMFICAGCQRNLESARMRSIIEMIKV